MTKDEIVADMDALPIANGVPVLIHSSLKSLGFVEGGTDAVLDALIEVVVRRRGDKAYETHVSWVLFEAERAASGHGYGYAGLKQVRWTLGRQQANGWFADNDLQDSHAPLTHTIGYVLRGVIEAYRSSGEQCFVDSARKTADALLTTVSDDGHIPGKLDNAWRSVADYACLTGSAQIASCWLLLGRELDRSDYIDAAQRANAFVRRMIHVVGDANKRGGIKGSFPVDGEYGRFQYLNWAAKFALDAQRMECLANDQQGN